MKSEQEHKETKLERTRQWREINPDKIKEYQKQSLIKQAEKVICELCGKELTRHSLKRHQKGQNCNNQAI